MEALLLSPLGRTVLASAVVSIGRTMNNQLVVDDAKVASQHAELHLVGEGYTIINLASTNGTFVNAQRLASNVPHPLTTGDMIRIGNTEFKYEVHSDAQATSVPASVGSTEVSSTTGEPAYPSTLPAASPTDAAASPQTPAPQSVSSTEATSVTGEPAYPSTPPATSPTYAATVPQPPAPQSVSSTEATGSIEAILLSPAGRTVLASSMVSIGSAEDNHLVVDDAKVASHHAELHLVGEGYTIINLASTNGTFVNAQRIASKVPHPLTTGDIIRVGDTAFRYEVSGGAQVTSAPPVASTPVPTTTEEPAYPSTLPAAAPTYAAASQQASAPSFVAPTEDTSSLEAILLSPAGRTVLTSAVVSIGSAGENDLVVNDAKIASQHVELRRGGEGYTITDLGSTSGTFVNAQRLASNVPHPLTTGDMLRVGNTPFRYEVSNGAQAASAPSFVTPTEVTSIMGEPAYQSTFSATAPTYAAASQTPAPSFVAPTEATSTAEELVYPSTLPTTAPTYAAASLQASAPQPVGSTAVPSATRGQAYQSTRSVTAPAFAAAPQKTPAPSFIAPTAVPSSSTPTQPKKSSRGLWITLAVIAALLVIAVGAFAFVGRPMAVDRATPSKTLTTFCDNVKNKDYAMAYRQLSARRQAKIPEADFTSLLSSASSCTFSSVVESQSHATATLKFFSTSGDAVNAPTDLVQEGDNWKIDAINLGS